MDLPTPEEPDPAQKTERVLIDALLVAHDRYVHEVRGLCAAAVRDERPLSATDIGAMLVAQAQVELAAVAASFVLCDHWAAADGTGWPDLGDLKSSLEAETGRIADREALIGSLEDNLARNQRRARRLTAEPALMQCEIFLGEVILERYAVAAVAGVLLDTCRDLYVWNLTQDGGAP